MGRQHFWRLIEQQAEDKAMQSRLGNRPKILLFGSTGQVGRKLAAQLQEIGEVIRCIRRTSGLREFPTAVLADLHDRTALRSIVREVSPEIIVNAAAYTNVDQAELEPAEARAVNCEAPAVLAQEAEKCSALLVHFSTDYVFDGRKASPFNEFDTPCPLNVYGRTKLDGEDAIRANCHRHLILRTSWVYDAHGRNFFTNLMGRFDEPGEIRMATDQIGAPTPAGEVGRMACQAIQRVAMHRAFYGTYHETCGGACSKFEFAQSLFDIAREQGLPVRPDRLAPAQLRDFGLPAARPLNCRLNCRRLMDTFGIEPRHWRSALPQLVEEWRSAFASCDSVARVLA